MDITKKKVIFIDMDGTLIDTESGKTFPEGVWDMKLKMEVFAQLKKLHPQAVLIVSNQGGIELGRVHPAMFQPKFIYVIACLQSYIGLNTLVAGQFCPYNDKKHPKRKPNPGMLEDMLAEFTHNTGITISKEDCLMIGDASGLEGQFSDSDLKTAENFGCDYLDVTEFTNMELPEPLFKVIDMHSGEVVKDKDDNLLEALKESEAMEKVAFLQQASPDPKARFTYVPQLWECPKEPEQRPEPQPKAKILNMNPKK